MSGSQSPNNLRFIALLLLLGLAAAINAISAWGVETEPLSIEPVAPHASTSSLQETVDNLDPRGSLLFTSNGLKIRICKVFGGKTAVAQDRPPVSGDAFYRTLKPGALLDVIHFGVIHFLAEASEDCREDFHDQKLRPSYYTMRYAARPDSDTVDFVLLSPLSMDRDPSRVLPIEELIRLSRSASHTKQPAVMGLVPIDLGGDDFPGLKTESGSTQELALAIVVITPKKQQEDHRDRSGQLIYSVVPSRLSVVPNGSA
jgi:hypothetical protein